MHMSGVVLEVAAVLALSVVLGLLAQRVHLPLTVVLVVVAFVASTVGIAPALGELEGEVFEQVVVIGLLPALVFAAALGIDLRAFTRTLGAIVALAVVGFALSALLVGITLHLVLGTALVVSFLFGAIISATDPVAVVAIFRRVGVPRRLLTIVEGESLLNDGVAIVLFAILVDAATGGVVNPGAGVLRFLAVFLGGALIGAALGLLASLILPWLDAHAAVALTVAVAYGSFLLAEEVLGFSGVMSTAAAGMLLSGFGPSRASAEVRTAWHETWGALDHMANAILFVLIGLALDPAALVEEIGPILLAVVVVLAARAAAVLPVVWALERLARLPRVGRRNEAVLVWGGLRGGIALALALALPPELAERDQLVALTGGVVLATLLLNATTIGWLVHRLGLDESTPVDVFLTAVTRLSGVSAAREQLDELGLSDVESVEERLADVEKNARHTLQRLELTPQEQTRIVLGRGLHIERRTYQDLSDQGLLPPAVTRALMHQVDDEVDTLGTGGDVDPRSRRPQPPLADRLSQRVLGWLPRPAGENLADLRYAEASARRLAARLTVRELELFNGLPAIDPGTVRRAQRAFEEWEASAVHQLEQLDQEADLAGHGLHAQQAQLLARAATERQLAELARTGLLPQRVQEEP
jgi:CPA1 family monovalent cation:H+ antiporter